MASFTLNIPDELAPTVTTVLCQAGGYADITEDNAKKAVIDWITVTVHNVQTAQAQAKMVAPVVAPITGLS
jgi:hypothetical protein